MTVTETELIAFKTITSFINDLNESFYEDYPSIKLYHHLLSKTTLSHDSAISKHVKIWQQFCIDNRETIQVRSEKLSNPIVEYSEKVTVDLSTVFNLCKGDKETKNVIWQHILTISALLDLAGEARKVLKELNEKGGGGEADFLGDIITKIEDTVDPNADPMTAISSVMSSGIFTDLISGMGEGLQSGELDINKLMGSVQTMVSKMDKTPSVKDLTDSTDVSSNTSPAECPFDVSKMMDIMAKSSNNASSQTADGMPDISKLLGPMMDMMTKKPPNK